MNKSIAIAAALTGVLFISSPAWGREERSGNVKGTASDLATQTEPMGCTYRTPNLWVVNDSDRVEFVNFDELERGEKQCQSLTATGGSYPIAPEDNQWEYSSRFLLTRAYEINESINLNSPPPFVIGRTNLENQEWGAADTFLGQREDELTRNIRSNSVQLILGRLRL